MTDEIWKRDEIESPCVKICVIHPDARLCLGCLRTPDEIATWSRKSPQERRQIMSELADRAPALTKPREGRRRRKERGRSQTD